MNVDFGAWKMKTGTNILSRMDALKEFLTKMFYDVISIFKKLTVLSG